MLSKASPWLDKRLQGAAFFDMGQVFTNKTSPRFILGVSSRYTNSGLMGAGVGLRFRLSQCLMGFLDVGFGLVDRSKNEANAQPTGRVYFGIRSDMISQAYR